MAKKIINIGAKANDRGGDLIRTAFLKINENFTELYAGLPLLSVGSTPPPAPHTDGEQWWDTSEGNSYIWYDGAWVPSTSSVADQTKNVRTNTGNSLNIDFQVDGVITTTQTTDITVAFSNFTVGSRVRVIVATSATSLIVNLGVLATKSSNGTTVARPSTVPSIIVLDYMCTTTQASGVFVTVSTSSSASFSGSYTDLTNKPTGFSSLVNGANTASLDSNGVLTVPDSIFGNGTSLALSTGATAPGAAVAINTSEVDFNFSDARGGFKFKNLGGATGSITFPDNTVQTTAFQKVAPPAHDYGAAGDKIGMLAFDANYIYYCTANYVNNATVIWKRTAYNTIGTW